MFGIIDDSTYAKVRRSLFIVSATIGLIAAYDLTLKFPSFIISSGSGVTSLPQHTTLIGLFASQIYLLYRHLSYRKIIEDRFDASLGRESDTKKRADRYARVLSEVSARLPDLHSAVAILNSNAAQLPKEIEEFGKTEMYRCLSEDREPSLLRMGDEVLARIESATRTRGKAEGLQVDELELAQNVDAFIASITYELDQAKERAERVKSRIRGNEFAIEKLEKIVSLPQLADFATTISIEEDTDRRSLHDEVKVAHWAMIAVILISWMCVLWGRADLLGRASSWLLGLAT